MPPWRMFTSATYRHPKTPRAHRSGCHQQLISPPIIGSGNKANLHAARFKQVQLRVLYFPTVRGHGLWKCLRWSYFLPPFLTPHPARTQLRLSTSLAATGRRRIASLPNNPITSSINRPSFTRLRVLVVNFSYRMCLETESIPAATPEPNRRIMAVTTPVRMHAKPK